MAVAQRWGFTFVLGLAIAAIGFVALSYDRFVGLAAIPLAVAFVMTFVRPAAAPRVGIFGSIAGLAVAIGYMVWAGMHRNEISNSEEATRAVQVTLAVCGFVLLSSRAVAVTTDTPKKVVAHADRVHRSTDAVQLGYGETSKLPLEPRKTGPDPK